MKLRIFAATIIVMCVTLDAAATTPQPASKAAEVTQDPIAKQNQVNQEYLERATKGPSGAPGVWYQEDNGSIVRYTREGDTFRRSFIPVNSAGEIAPEIVTTYQLDKARGTVLYRSAGKSYTLRYLRDDKDSYRVQYLPELDATPRMLAPPYILFRFAGERLQLIPGNGNESSERVWTDSAKAQARQSSRAPEIAIESRWGVLARLVGQTFWYDNGYSGYLPAMRLRWVVPGQSMQMLSKNNDGWLPSMKIELGDDPSTLRVTSDKGVASTARVSNDGSITFVDGNYSTAWWLKDGVLFTRFNSPQGYHDTNYYPETSAGIAKRPPAVMKYPGLAELEKMTPEEYCARRNAQEEARWEASGSGDFEAERAAKAAAWDATAGQAKSELDQSLQNLNETVSNIQAQQGTGGGRQTGSTRDGSYIEIEDKQADARAVVPAATTATTAPARDEQLLGVLGTDCAAARAEVQRRFGNATIVHEIPQGSACLVQIDIDTAQHTNGAASSQ